MAKKTSAFEKEEQLQSAYRLAVINNIILGVLIVVSAGSFIYFNFLSTQTVDLPEEAIIKEIKDRVAANADQIVKEGADLAAETVPPASEAFMEQVRKDFPEYVQVAEDQGEELVENLRISLRHIAKKKFREFLEKNRQVLKEEIPSVAGDEAVEKLEAEFEKSYVKLIERYHVKKFQKEVDRTREYWAKIEPLDNPPPREVMEDQLFELGGDYVLLKVKDLLDSDSEQ